MPTRRKINEAIAENSYLQRMQTLTTEIQMAFMENQKLLRTVEWYEQTGLKNAEIISSAATKQFTNGDINYLEWVMLINQSVSIKSQYIDLIKNLNETINQINYLNSK